MWRDILKISTEDAIQDARRYAPKDVQEGEQEQMDKRLEKIKPTILTLTTQYMGASDPKKEMQLLNAIKQLMREFPSTPKLRNKNKNLNEAHIYEFLGEELEA
tara:strand:- start:1306 stop:1614 length:309 start_codon:yes stop_codon:yes gene_type:complete